MTALQNIWEWEALSMVSTPKELFLLLGASSKDDLQCIKYGYKTFFYNMYNGLGDIFESMHLDNISMLNFLVEHMYLPNVSKNTGATQYFQYWHIGMNEQCVQTIYPSIWFMRHWLRHILPAKYVDDLHHTLQKVFDLYPTRSSFHCAMCSFNLPETELHDDQCCVYCHDTVVRKKTFRVSQQRTNVICTSV